MQVTLKLSSWWHSQGGEGHPFAPRLLGRARSSASCSRRIGLIFRGSPRRFLQLHYRVILKPSAPRVLQGEGEREAWTKGGLVGVVTSAPRRRLERGKERLLSVPFP